MRKIISIFVLSLLPAAFLLGQSGEAAPNYANASSLPPAAAQASKMNSMPVNLFTGIPSVSVPIYSYSSNSGIGMAVSLEYSGGGVQAAESPSITGLSWALNAGGMITRTVRGMPDDMPTYGYLYSAAIPADWRADARKYYHDSLDTQQDIFQFNFPGHSGKFYLGKNGQIATVPLSKIRIIPAFQSASAFNQTLKSFRIIAEDGVKYDFDDAEHTGIGIDLGYFGSGYTPTASGYYDKPYGTSWYLSRIISPFNADTIKFNYDTKTSSYGFKLPQITYVNNANGTRKNPSNAPGYGNSTFRKLTSIQLPDKTTVSFIYSYGTKYNENDYALSKIKISDTAFRFGYLLGYDSVHTYIDYSGHTPRTEHDPIRLLLTSVTPYTKWEKQQGYQFEYKLPPVAKFGTPKDTIQNMRDYWGYYNGIDNNDSLIPQISPYTWGANRNPTSAATTTALLRFRLPTGGYIQYDYENNDHYPYTKQYNSIAVSLQSTTQNNITINQVYNSLHQLVFVLDKSVSRTGSAPVTGSGNLNIYLKSTDGTITYLSSTLSLYDLFYNGMYTYTFNLPNGTYRLETSLSSGTSVSGSLPASVNWETKTTDNSVNFNLAGGIRVKSIERHNVSDAAEGIIEKYKYIRSDGKSSGFLGDIPRYDFPYRGVYNNGSTIIDYTAVCSEPLGTTGFAGSGNIGYSRVEVIRETYAGNLGKEVQEFTDLSDVNSNVFSTAFPYTPQEFRTWGLGMPKRISAYDSSGVLVKRTVNTIRYDTTGNLGNDFRSIKLGHSQTSYAGPSNDPGVPLSKTYIGEPYYLSSGRAYVTSTFDTLYHSNATTSVTYQHMTYDTNYNVSKVKTSYDRNRGLEKETRMYYPYNYTVGGGVGKMRDSLIISQMIGMETWITDDANPSSPRLFGGAMTSFRQIGNGELKPDTIFSFQSNKPIAQSAVGVFDPGKLNRNTTYFKGQSFFTNYNGKGNLTEMKDLVSGRSNSILLDYDQEYPVAKISNAMQSEIAYTSFESTGSGNWTIGGTQRDLSYAVTGKKSYNLSNGNITRNSLSSSQHYLLTVWVKNGASVSVNSSALSGPIAAQNDWNFYSVSLTGVTSITISGSGLVDELRLHPKDANMVTSNYEPLVGMISSTDANNTIGYSEYDRLNRPKLARDKDKNIVQRFDYADTTMTVSMAPLWQGFEKRCSPTNPGQVDSLYRDMNVFSDSSGYSKWVYQGYLDCSCSEVSGLPQYKVVNGQCELGTWQATSTVYKKVLVDGYLQWRWVCTRRWCFSDYSTSTYFEETIGTSPCTVTCGGSAY